MKRRWIAFTLTCMMILPLMAGCGSLLEALPFVKKNQRDEAQADVAGGIPTEEAVTSESDDFGEQSGTVQETIPPIYVLGRVNGSAPVLANPDPSAATVRTKLSGETVYVRAYAYYGNYLYGDVGSGWIDLDKVNLDGAANCGGIPATINARELNMRSGPGTSFGSYGFLRQGVSVRVMEFRENNGLWARLDIGGWVTVSYLSFQNSVPLQGGVNGTIRYDAYDLVGTWIEYDDIPGTRTTPQGNTWPMFWTFKEDGTFSYGGCGYAFQGKTYDGATGGEEIYGRYDFDGKTLTLQITGQFYAGEDVKRDETRYYGTSFGLQRNSINGANVLRYNSGAENLFEPTLGGSYNHFVRDLAAIYHSKNAALNPMSGLWQAEDGSQIQFNSEGTVSRSYGGSSYSGFYVRDEMGWILFFNRINGGVAEDAMILRQNGADLVWDDGGYYLYYQRIL